MDGCCLRRVLGVRRIEVGVLSMETVRGDEGKARVRRRRRVCEEGARDFMLDGWRGKLNRVVV